MKTCIPVLVCFFVLLLSFNANCQALYSVAASGGEDGAGVVVKINLNEFTKEPLKEFPITNPGSLAASLVEAPNGKLYGVTAGGYNGRGLIFEYNPSTNSYTKKVNFSPTTKSFPGDGMTLASNGKFYGTRRREAGAGEIFEYDYQTNKLQNKVQFTGDLGLYPEGKLVQGIDGKLYGVSSGGGTHNKGVLFSYDIAANIITKIFDFSPETGCVPKGLMQGQGGKLYGYTRDGGEDNRGVLFSFDVGSQTYKKVDLRFLFPTTKLHQLSSGQLLGFFEDINSNGLSVCLVDPYDLRIIKQTSSELFRPFDFAEVVQIGRKIYTVGYFDDADLQGGIIEYNEVTNELVRKADFNSASGTKPSFGLMATQSGKIYGTTIEGGVGHGTLFEYELPTNSIKSKFNFSEAPDGFYPGGIVEGHNGKFYGRTTYGGIGYGTIFEYDAMLNTLITLHVFQKEEYNRFHKICFAGNGRLYGYRTYFLNGEWNAYLFEFDPSSRSYKELFNIDTLGDPNWHQLVVGSNGNLFGVLNASVKSVDGGLFEFNPYTSKVVHAQKMPVYNVSSNPIEGSNGKFYITAWSAPGYFCGAILEWDTSTRTIREVTKMPTDICSPYGNLVLSPGGKMYGLTYNGGVNNQGTLYEFDPATSQVKAHIKFDTDTDGQKPGGSLVYYEGKLYGSTDGYPGYGVTFEYDIAKGEIARRVRNEEGYYYQSSFQLFQQKKVQEISCLDKLEKFYGDNPFTIDASSDSGLGLRFISSDPSILSVEDNMLHINHPGTCQLFVTQQGDVSYFSNSKTVDVLIRKAGQSITFPPLESKSSGDIDFSPGAISSSSLQVSYTSSNESVASISGSMVKIQNDGQTSITAHQNGNEYYQPAEPVSQQLTVLKGTDDSFMLFPNPTDDIIKIYPTEKIDQVILYTPIGRSKELQLIDQSIDLTSFSNGLYVLELRCGDRKIKAKVVKK
jgi:uncharacterized repeat protein (TIGR03803 family)